MAVLNSKELALKAAEILKVSRSHKEGYITYTDVLKSHTDAEIINIESDNYIFK